MATFKANKRGLDQLQKKLQSELNKRPISIPIQAESPRPGSFRPRPMPTTTVQNTYTGPVVHYAGDGNPQIAFTESGDISQSQETQSFPIAKGYDELAKVVVALRAELAELGLTGAEGELAAESADDVITAIAQPEPEKAAVLKAVTMLKGTLTAITSGVNNAISAEATARAGAFIAQLSAALPV